MNGIGDSTSASSIVSAFSPAPAPPTIAAPPAKPVIEHPVVAPAPEELEAAAPVLDPEQPLPELKESDAPMADILAKLFADQGAKVAAIDLNEEGLQRVVAEIEAAGCPVRGWTLDLSDGPAIKRVIDEVAEHFGGLDLLVNSVSVNFFRNMGSDRAGKIMLEDMGPLSDMELAGHTTSPTIIDWDKNGIPDLLIGAEDGRFYYLKNPKAE